jgi:diphthine synthase
LALYIVGGGVSLEYLTLRALEVLGRVDKVYVDTYTSIAPGLDVDTLSKILRVEVVAADRVMLEQKSHMIVLEAREKDIAILVPGDPLTATTHIALALEARRAGVRVEIVPGVSGLQAVIDATGLQAYRFGKIVTLVYPEETYKPYSTVETVWFNYSNNLHTLVLLDLRLDEGKAMTIPEAVDILLQLEREYARETGRETVLEGALLAGVARAGLREQKCVAGRAEDLKREDYPPPPHSLVVVAPKPHPMEVEALKAFCSCKSC